MVNILCEKRNLYQIDFFYTIPNELEDIDETIYFKCYPEEIQEKVEEYFEHEIVNCEEWEYYSYVVDPIDVAHDIYGE